MTLGGELIKKGANAINGDVNSMNMHIVLGYISYFVLGYYLDNIALNKKRRIVVYVMGLLGFGSTIVLDLIVALKTQKYCDNYYGNFTINVLLEALAVFIWFKYRHYENDRLNAFIQKIAKYSFGAYLVHALVIEQLNTRIGLNTLSFNSILAVLCIGAIVFVVSFGISAILNHISVLRKYIV